jgi:hypothetical protein
MNKTEMRVRPGFIFALFLFFMVLYFLLMPISHSSIGNARMLLWTKALQIDLKAATTNSPSFDFYQTPQETQQKILRLGYNFHFWFKTNFSWANNSNRQVIIICEREYDNVPKPALWNFYRKNPAHAVGYSDGTAGLISPEQFTNLNLNGFVSLSSLATNSEFNIFK